MPRIVDLTQPYGGKGKYGDTFQGIANILDTIGKVERLRQERSLNAKVINVVAMGGGPQEIAKVLTEAQPQYESGAAGFLQKIANQFAPPSQLKSQFSQMAMKEALDEITPTQMLNQWRLNKLLTLTPEEQTQYLLKPPISIQTGQKLLGPEQRQEIAETDYREKVGLSASEKNLARKSVEDIFESTPLGANRLMGWHQGIKDYEKSTVINMYKQWITEQGYETKTPRQKKIIDEIWDGKIGLMNKTGFKFKDKERGRLSKNEIWWDQNDPEVVKLREGAITKTNSEAKQSPYPEYPDAFLEDGVWKVLQNGKKYRIED